MIEKKSEIDRVRSVARYSDCEKYRYTLARTWNTNKKSVVFIGLNPSTATELKNDPTVARIINYAKKWGFGSATILNLFAFRATFPDDLKKCSEPIGPENDKWILHELKNADKIVACWGNHGKFMNRSQEVLKFLNNFYHFGLTNQGEPRHVLYLKRDAELERF